LRPESTEAPTEERGLPAVRSAASLHSRLSNVLALGLMLTMGAIVLVGYYVHIAQRQAQSRQKAQTAASNRAQSEMPLPSLGPVAPVATATTVPVAAVEPSDTDSNLPLEAVRPGNIAPMPAGPGAAPAARVSALERRLSGNAFARSSATTDDSEPPAAAREEVTGAAIPTGNPASITSVSGAAVGLPHADFGSTASARLLHTQRMLLPKGAFIDCTLETAIDSTLPGMTTCVTATDTFGVDGRVVLLERGTKLVGETRGQVQQGSARVFVLWTEARTPAGVIVPLDSPGTDELGRSGLSGSVDRHFWERFGAALLVSAVDGAVQAAVQSSSRGGGAIIYNPSAAQDVTTEVLKSTLSIPPTVRKQNGDRIQILVARDIDFTSVYELRHAPRQP
jgi:type IV secretion system protein VirB10